MQNAFGWWIEVHHLIPVNITEMISIVQVLYIRINQCWSCKRRIIVHNTLQTAFSASPALTSIVWSTTDPSSSPSQSPWPIPMRISISLLPMWAYNIMYRLWLVALWHSGSSMRECMMNVANIISHDASITTLITVKTVQWKQAAYFIQTMEVIGDTTVTVAAG